MLTYAPWTALPGLRHGFLGRTEPTGPPWDVHFGAYVGTWSASVNFDEQIAPNGHHSLGSVAGGRIVYADGHTQYFQILFRLVLPPDGPPKLFLVNFVCGGAA